MRGESNLNKKNQAYFHAWLGNNAHLTFFYYNAARIASSVCLASGISAINPFRVSQVP